MKVKQAVIQKFEETKIGRRFIREQRFRAFFSVSIGQLVLLSFTLAGVVYISLFQNVAVKHHEIVMITIATYTFYKITVAIIRAIKQRKNTVPLLVVIRTIGYAEVAASLLTLQRSMLISFGSMDSENIALMNGLTGISVCLFILLLGIFTILRSGKERKNTHGTV